MIQHSSVKKSYPHKLTLLEIFRTLPKPLLREFFGCVERLRIRGGEVLFSEGSIGKDIYILLAGKLLFEKKQTAGGSQVQGTFRRQDLIGELSLFTGETRSATVRAVRDSEIIRIPAEEALRILEKSPDALWEITRIIAKRLAHANELSQFPRDVSKSFTFLSSLGRKEAMKLIDAFGISYLRFGSFCVVDEGLYEQRVTALAKGDKVENESAAIRFLSRLEAEYDLVIYFVQEDDKNEEWVSLAIRQGDAFVFCKKAESITSCARWKHLLDSTEKNDRAKYLALVQPNSDTVLPGTIRHLEEQDYERHFHIHLDRLDTLQRFVRGLLGKSIGLALGGGGAKGFAHLGVWQVLVENGIPIDMVSGTSAGSIFAALIAMGKTVEEAKIDTKHIWVERDLLNEYTLPLIALTSGKKYTETIQNFFGEIQIEDLWIPFLAVSCNLTKSETVLHTRGPLWKAIRASTSIPGIVPPFLDADTILVDGGVLDNVPGIPLLERGAGTLLAVDVMGEQNDEEDSEIKGYLQSSKQGVLANPFSPLVSYMQKNLSFRPKFPPIGDIIMRSFLTSSKDKQRATERRSTLYIKIPTNQYGVLDWQSFAPLVDLGYEVAKREILSLGESLRIWKL